MRSIGAGFGLVAFMIAIAISLWMWATYTKEVAHYGQRATAQAQQFSGHDEDGRPAMASFELEPDEQQGKLHSLVVDKIRPEGAMAKTFGLQPKDAIVAAGPMNFKEYGYDEEMAKALILMEFQKGPENGHLTILRNGQVVSLPVPKKKPVPAEGEVPGEGQAAANNKPAGDEKDVPKALEPLKGVLK